MALSSAKIYGPALVSSARLYGPALILLHGTSRGHGRRHRWSNTGRAHGNGLPRGPPSWPACQWRPSSHGSSTPKQQHLVLHMAHTPSACAQPPRTSWHRLVRDPHTKAKALYAHLRRRRPPQALHVPPPPPLAECLSVEAQGRGQLHHKRHFFCPLPPPRGGGGHRHNGGKRRGG